ncbi:MAG: DMT family transporter [Oscillatoriales cyanobacterium C42_A2020_001]|nr:DMT family transporter [Leptolyngbyaceae cyanobacterium C42_A2020_001]
MSDRPAPWRLGLTLASGILAVSTSAPLVRLAMAAAMTQTVSFSFVLAALRLSFAAVMLLPAWRSVAHSKPTPVAIGYAIAAGITLAIHFATWITSLTFTSIAASTALVTTNPVWVALLSWVWLGEKPTRRVLLGTGIALIGGLLIGLGGTDPSATGSHPLLGDGLALVGAWMVSLYFLLGREAQRNGLSLSSYVAIAYSVAAIALLPLPLLTGTSYTGYSSVVYGYIVLTALLPQIVGHTSFNWAVRWMSPTVVTLAILFEPVLASLMGFVLFKEIPDESVLTGALVLLIGVAIAAIA